MYRMKKVKLSLLMYDRQNRLQMRIATGSTTLKVIQLDYMVPGTGM